MSTGAWLCRQEPCDVDRSIVCYRQEHAHRSIVVSTGASFCRHEHYFVDRSVVLAAGAQFCPQENGFVDKSHAMSTGA